MHILTKADIDNLIRACENSAGKIYRLLSPGSKVATAILKEWGLHEKNVQIFLDKIEGNFPFKLQENQDFEIIAIAPFEPHPLTMGDTEKYWVSCLGISRKTPREEPPYSAEDYLDRYTESLSTAIESKGKELSIGQKEFLKEIKEELEKESQRNLTDFLYKNDIDLGLY